jgi:hypothetical protein
MGEINISPQPDAPIVTCQTDLPSCLSAQLQEGHELLQGALPSNVCFEQRFWMSLIQSNRRQVSRCVSSIH